MSDTKTCSRCKTVKPLADFHRRGPRGLQADCKTCKAERKLEWIKANPEKEQANKLWSKYRLRPDDLLNILESQDNSCALCDLEFGESTVTHIDHDHACCPGPRSCGECVRGVLCARCNLALGAFESLDLDRVRDYLHG
jgi:hypothetical protein